MDDESSVWFTRMRKDLGLTQEDVADALNVTTRTVINWERGHHEPRLTIRQVKALCTLLRVSLDQIPDDFPNGNNADHGRDMTSVAT
ncbi:MAG: helix-turn-helix transcriptional regulator [Leptolyngbyaceae cyanobacterium SL_7_1]|nr:helix-turn-helix transcriptional regulator [Leptolyngbyaceae cyanobacterium SL_7_1]